MSKTTTRTSLKTEQSGRVFGYARVSTEKQSSEGHSLADQDQRIRGYATSIGLNVTEMFVEAGISGGKKLSLRPKGAQLLAKLQHGDHVIATRLDRLFRSASDALNVVEECRAKGVHLHLPDIGGDCTGNGVAKLVVSILAAVAEMEKSRISERVRSVKQHLRQSGYFTGGIVPRGFSVTTDGKLAADKNWNRCLKTMKTHRENGMPYREIADRISKDFGVFLDYSTVFRILNGKRELDSMPA